MEMRVIKVTAIAVMITVIYCIVIIAQGNQEFMEYKQFLEPCEIIDMQNCEDADSEEEDGSGSVSPNEFCLPFTIDDCNKTSKLHCSDGICIPDCHPSKEDYDPDWGKCYTRIGMVCNDSRECGMNTLCEDKHCICSSNFTVEPDTGKCVKSAGFGEVCDSNAICDILSGMGCKNEDESGVGRCECQIPQSQFYHAEQRRCFLRIGEHCGAHNNFPSFHLCVDHGECIRVSGNASSNFLLDEDGENFSPEEFEFRCVCNKGYAPTLEDGGRSCLGIYGVECNSLQKCNTERSLHCYNNGICQCIRPTDQIFNEEFQRCVTLVGSLCEEENQDVCVPFAQCKEDKEAGVKVKRCHCISGFSAANKNESCLRHHGQNCTDGGGEVQEPLCNMDLGLECSNITGTCQCHSEQFYDVRMKTCRNFQVVERIPTKHFDFSDREYLFHLRNEGNEITTFSRKMLTLVVVTSFILYAVMG